MLSEVICDYRKKKRTKTEGTKMSRKTENQVAEMKKQTIGVEVEMNSITREKAAKLAAKFF